MMMHLDTNYVLSMKTAKTIVLDYIIYSSPTYCVLYEMLDALYVQASFSIQLSILRLMLYRVNNIKPYRNYEVLKVYTYMYKPSN